MSGVASRPACARCRRPATVCWCAALAPVVTRTQVVFLQHPREARRRLGTCRMAHLGLAGSELVVAVGLDDHPRVRALAADAGAAVLFPGPGAQQPEAVAPRTLVVVDGTWPEARKLLARSGLLARLPRVGVSPPAPGRYRIRREPAPHCLATVEAVVEVLVRLEGGAERFAPLRAAFERLVDAQVAFAAREHQPWRHARRARRGRPGPAERVAAELAAAGGHLLAVHAEASPQPGGSDLVQLVAVRPATGARFASLVQPARPPDPRTLAHVGVSHEALAAAPGLEAVRAAWRAFARPDDVLATWGRFAHRLLVAHGVATSATIDVRAAAARALGGRAGDVEATLRALGGGTPVPWSPGRAGRRAAALAWVVAALAEATLAEKGRSRTFRPARDGATRF